MRQKIDSVSFLHRKVDQLLDAKIVKNGAIEHANQQALRELVKNKKQHPLYHLVIDTDGVGRNMFDLQPGGYALVILDKNKRVLFFAEGELSKEQVSKSLNIIEKSLN